MNFSKWEDEEVKTLFKFVEVKKSEGMPLIKIFEEYANKTYRHKNSVRNYYYKEVNALTLDNERAKYLNINLSGHSVMQAKEFTKDEKTKLISDIQELKEKGYSVRRACMELSGGDISKMIRLQNKYRLETKKGKGDNMGQIIKMPFKQQGLLDDEDIKSLFLGLIKLVKRQEYERAKIMFNKDVMSANDKLKQAMLKIASKQNEIDVLKQNIKLLNNELLVQKKKLQDVCVSYNSSKAKDMLTEYLKRKNQTENNIISK